MSRLRYWIFVAITVLSPFVLLAVVEVVLRVTWKGGDIPVFVHAPEQMGNYLLPNPALGQRYFALQQHPPSPLAEPFAAQKPAHGYRVFVLGASAAAGFPWPPSGTFSRLLQDVLRDVMPGDSVEVINLAIPATNSYAILDQTDAVIAQHPDAVLIYSGHNEYYGALGVGSTESVGSSPTLVRAYLWLERFRTFMALRDAMAWLRRAFVKPPEQAQQAASFMEVVARNQEIRLGGPAYEAGVRQFRGNLERILAKFHAAHIPVFIGSLASNERMHPFASPVNAAAGGADAVYDSATSAEARHDTVAARRLFERAENLDVVRFRAPGEFDRVIREVAHEEDATYVPVDEAFKAASPDSVVGNNLILEHVHPNQAGVALLAHAFWMALDSAHFDGHSVQLARMKPWGDYVAEMDITPFDRRMVALTVKTLTERWPFVPVAQDRDYRDTYRPTGVVDSLALLASALVLPWPQAKVEVGQYYEKAGFPDSALAEYRGLIRVLPWTGMPYALAGRALMAMKQTDSAVVMLKRSYEIQPNPYAAYTLGVEAAQQHAYDDALGYFQEAMRLDPTDPHSAYELSLTYAMMHNLEGARAAAQRVYQIQPGFPGLQRWMKALGMGGG